jgi:hypothetical protein
MTPVQIIELVRIGSEIARFVPMDKQSEARQAVWNALPEEDRAAFLQRGVPAHIEPLVKILLKTGKGFSEVFRSLTPADQVTLLSWMVTTLLHPVGDWQDFPGPTGTGLVSPASMSEDGRFQVSVQDQF